MVVPFRDVEERLRADAALGVHVQLDLRTRHELLPAIESRMIEAYSAGASSQTKWPASMILRRLLGSRSSRNSALAGGTTRSWRPLTIVTGVEMPGRSSASAGNSSGYVRT